MGKIKDKIARLTESVTSIEDSIKSLERRQYSVDWTMNDERMLSGAYQALDNTKRELAIAEDELNAPNWEFLSALPSRELYHYYKQHNPAITADTQMIKVAPDLVHMGTFYYQPPRMVQVSIPVSPSFQREEPIKVDFKEYSDGSKYYHLAYKPEIDTIFYIGK